MYVYGSLVLEEVVNDKEIQKVEDMEVGSKKREKPLAMGRYEENVTCMLAHRKERVTDDKANRR